MTTAQVAIMMLYGVRKSRLDYQKEYNDYDPKFVTCMDFAMEWLQNNPEYDEPVAFPWTTNYCTFIWKDKKLGLCVSTCNNQEEYWDMLGARKWVEYDHRFEYGKESTEFLALDCMRKFSEHDYYEYRMAQWKKPSTK